MTEIETRLVNAIVWREDLYSRFEPIPARIQQYAECLDLLPPIEINQHNELIDGYHRWTAHKKAGVDTINVIVTHTASDIELDRLSARRNAQFGIQLSQEEKRSKVQKWYTGKDSEKQEFANELSISLRIVQSWLSRKDKDLKEERNRRIFDMWLSCYTEDEIAEAVGCSVQPVKDVVQERDKNADLQKNLILATYQDPDWKPPLYDVWKAKEKSNGTSHFGNSEMSFVDNLLYLYTEPYDIIVDPFAGGGSSIDVCKKRLRRYWASDRLPIVERRDIRQWDILAGPPPLHKRWQDVSLMYLDPPYWIQAEGQYSKDGEDLANMPLERFYDVLTGYVTACAQKMRDGARIAMIIQPTQWKAPDRKVIDHIIDIICRLQAAPLRYERRIVCPYESQQCNAQQVEWAKASRDILVISREIIIWKVTK